LGLRWTPFIVTDVAVKLSQVFTQPLLAGDRPTFFCRDDATAELVHLLGGIAQPRRKRIIGGQFSGPIFKAGAHTINSIRRERHIFQSMIKLH
jgi:hypothetical protein